MFSYSNMTVIKCSFSPILEGKTTAKRREGEILAATLRKGMLKERGATRKLRLPVGGGPPPF